MISAPPPLNGMCSEIETGALGEDFGIDLLIAADAGAAVADLARMFLGIGQELGECAGGKFVVVARKKTGTSARGVMIWTSRA